ncbi:MAG: fatty acid desaturase [Candidatus Sericytochromatia bacterium]
MSPVQTPLQSEFTRTFAEIDYAGFAAELDALQARLMADLGEKDLRHLGKMERWGKASTLLGYATAWMLPNPLSAFLISLGNVTRWGLFMHHIGHRGFDRVPNVPPRWHSKTFAKGWRRWIDWPDWLMPEAWKFEHNTLHHSHTGERLDPDLMEDRVRLMRETPAGMPELLWSLMKYPVATFVMCTWKISYYAPNTLWMQQLRLSRPGRQGLEAKVIHQPAIFHGAPLWWPFSKAGMEFWTRCVLPYSLLRFVLLPLLFLPLGPQASLFVLLNSLLAELITNLHTFAIIAPNHSGEDLYRFEGRVTDKAEYYVRQVTGSVNYTGGSDVADFFQAWLNYQIEHHLWPDMPLLKLREAQPEVQAICERYGVPYVIEPLPKRVWKMLRLLYGKSMMHQGKTLQKGERGRLSSLQST